MNRRDFIKMAMYAGGSCLLPRVSFAANPLDNVIFNPSRYLNNKPQTIMIFLYGGASELAGNFTNYNEFKELSQSSYASHFRGQVNSTANGFWAEAGGTLMEELLEENKLNVFRTCYSQKRWNENNRSHGPCTVQNQRGSFNGDAPGIFSNIGRVLKQHNMIDGNTKMPFLSMEGESGFYATGNLARDPMLVPMSINENLDNPFRRSYERDYTARMDILAQQHNPTGKIRDAFNKLSEMESFITSIEAEPDPNDAYFDIDDNRRYSNSSFARKLKAAVKIMDFNPDTHIISLGTGGLGGWDDHNEARDYITRMNELFLALRSAMAHIDYVGKRNQINIVVMSEFGRGVNLNSANGWDHGNLQSLYVLGGTDYFNSTTGVFGTTKVANTGSVNRLYLQPANSNWFEPLSVASTLYSIYGIDNPEVLTDNQPVISDLLG